MKTIRIGSGAGYAGDRIDPAVQVLENGNVDYICYECLAERTIAAAQLLKQEDPSKGCGQFLEERMEATIPYVADKGVKMISNLGAANPEAALEKTIEIANRLHAKNLKIAIIMGDDVLDKLSKVDSLVWETGEPVKDILDKVISANAYIGVDAMLPALQANCNIIIAGRVSDPSLFLAPMVYEFGWKLDDWHLLGAGTAAAHLIECAAQVTGGYFADPGKKDVPDLLNVGFPIIEIDENGSTMITKAEGTGGMVTVETCKEQIMYEIFNPAEYLTPDVTANFSNITIYQEGLNQVRVNNASGKVRPNDLKVTLGIKEGFVGEGEISYAGTGALDRAKLSLEIMKARLKRLGISERNMKFEIIGLNSLLGSITECQNSQSIDVRLRVAAKVDNRRMAERVGEEVEALWLNGPAAPGGARKYVKPVIASYSTTISRELIKPSMIVKEV